MGNYDELKQAVSDVIKTNWNQEITGSILQNALLTIISTVGYNATFAGIATPETNPGTPDQNVFYIASKNGTYSNFNGITLSDEVSILSNKNGSWKKDNTGLATQQQFSELKGYFEILDSVDVCNEELEILSVGTTNTILTNNGGTVSGYNNYDTTDYIDVDIVMSYYFRPNQSMSDSFCHIAFYDINKQFMLGVKGSLISSLQQRLYKILMPTNARFFRVCGQRNNIQLYKSIKAESLDNIISNKVINDVLVGGINLFNRGKISLNKSFDEDGTEIDKKNYFVSDYINISQYTRISIKEVFKNSDTDTYVFYDKDKNILKRGYSKDVKNSETEGAYFVRISSMSYSSYLNVIMVCAGNLPSIYVPCTMADKYTRYDIDSSYRQLELPLNNKAEIINTTYESGIFGSTHSGYETSDYIAMPKNGFIHYYYAVSTYSSGLSKVKFYDKDKVEIGSINGAEFSGYKNIFIRMNYPNGCEYVRYARNVANPNDGIYTCPYMSLEDAIKEVINPTTNLKNVLWLGTSIPEGATYPEVSCVNNGYNCINNAFGSSRLCFTGANDPVTTTSGIELTATVDELKSLYSSHIGVEITQTEFNIWLDKSYERSVLPFVKGESLTITDGTTNAADGIINPDSIKVDAIIIDHGYNDNVSVNAIMEDIDSADWKSTDRSNFIGAFNYIINEIQKINPTIKIIVGGYFDYTFQSSGKPLGKNLCDLQTLLAQRYSFELFDVWNYTQINYDRFVKGTANYISDFNTKYGTSYTVPSWMQNSDGDIRSHLLYCPDGIHPHSDKTGQTNKRLNAIYTKLMRSIL